MSDIEIGAKKKNNNKKKNSSWSVNRPIEMFRHKGPRL